MLVELDGICRDLAALIRQRQPVSMGASEPMARPAKQPKSPSLKQVRKKKKAPSQDDVFRTYLDQKDKAEVRAEERWLDCVPAAKAQDSSFFALEDARMELDFARRRASDEARFGQVMKRATAPSKRGKGSPFSGAGGQGAGNL